MNKKGNMRERALKQLRLYLFFGSLYLVGTLFWLVAKYATGQLELRITFLWLLGSAGYLIGMAFASSRLQRIIVKGLEKPVSPDERQELIADKAANATVWWTMLVLLADLGGRWANTGRVPVETAVFLFLMALFYSGYYMYYLRKYS